MSLQSKKQYGTVDTLFAEKLNDVFDLFSTKKGHGGDQINQLLSNDNKLAFFKTLMTKDIPAELKINTQAMKFDGFEKLMSDVNQTKVQDISKQQAQRNREQTEIVINNSNLDGPSAMN